MACNIPNFTFDFQVVYDISSATPSVKIVNQSTGSNLANIDYFFILYTPSGVAYHTGSWLAPDASGIWVDISSIANIPQSNGHVEFSNLPYRVEGYAKDNLGNLCEHTEQDIICAPTGNTGKDNYGKVYFQIKQKCETAVLEVIDTSNYLYQGVIGTVDSNDTVFVYPTNEGSPVSNAVVSGKMAFTLPIPVNSAGHELYSTTVITYTLSSGNTVKVKYKYSHKNIIVNCNVSKCSIMCGLTKYREKIEGKSGRCSETDAIKISTMTIKIAQLMLGLNEPNCGFDVYTLHDEIKAELLSNDCYCECEDSTGNNQTTALRCNDIDIQCVWNEIAILMAADQPSKDQFCNLVTDCLNSINSSACSQVFISGVLFTETQITVNFQLAVTTNSVGVKVYYKEHSSGVWILDATLASNATTHDITGTFAAGDTYDVKVVNDCGAGGTVDSSIVTGIIIQAMSSQYLLNLIYGAAGNGDYVVNVAGGVPSLKLIDQALIDPFLPCPIPEYLAINSGSILSWVGSAGDYEIQYKLKSDPNWISYGLFTYGTLSVITEDLSALIAALIIAVPTSALSDYEFRVKKECNNGASLWAITSYNAPLSQCKGPGAFIGFNQSTGVLRWSGTDNPAVVWICEAVSGGSSLGTQNPLSIASIPFGTIVEFDYSNIVALIAATSILPGDEITFIVYQDCGSSIKSDIATHTYVVTEVGTCQNVSLTFTDSNGGLVTIDIPSFPANVDEVQYELGQFFLGAGPGGSNLFVPFITGTTSLVGVTPIFSPIIFKTGDSMYVRWRAKCSCCSNDRAYSNWDYDVNLAVNQYWDDEWKIIPNGWKQNSATVTGHYKFDRNGKFHLRGLVDLGTLSPTPYQYPATAATHVQEDFLDLTSLASFINPSVDFVGGVDYWPAQEKTPLADLDITVNGSIKRTGAMLSVDIVISNAGAGVANGIQLNLSHISIY